MARAAAFKLAILISLAWITAGQWPNRPSVAFLNVGQGLAVLYQNNGYTLLFDTGPDQTVLSELGSVLPLTDRTIDLIIISHEHTDHLAGLLAVLSSYQVEEIWLPTLSDNELNQAVLNSLKSHPETAVRYPVAGEWRVLPTGETIAVWHPGKVGGENHASTITVALTSQHGNRLLLTGDLDAADEQTTLDYCHAWTDCSARTTLLQVSHHGSATSTSQIWLETITPSRAVISVGENSYGHPNADTLTRLSGLNIPTDRTDQTGRVLTHLP